MAKVNLSMPEDGLWKVQRAALDARERFGPYCVRLLVEHGLKGSDESKAVPKTVEPLSRAPQVADSGSAVRGPRRDVATRRSAAALQEKTSPEFQ